MIDGRVGGWVGYVRGGDYKVQSVSGGISPSIYSFGMGVEIWTPYPFFYNS